MAVVVVAAASTGLPNRSLMDGAAAAGAGADVVCFVGVFDIVEAEGAAMAPAAPPIPNSAKGSAAAVTRAAVVVWACAGAPKLKLVAVVAEAAGRAAPRPDAKLAKGSDGDAVVVVIWGTYCC